MQMKIEINIIGEVTTDTKAEMHNAFVSRLDDVWSLEQEQLNIVTGVFTDVLNDYLTIGVNRWKGNGKWYT